MYLVFDLKMFSRGISFNFKIYMVCYYKKKVWMKILPISQVETTFKDMLF